MIKQGLLLSFLFVTCSLFAQPDNNRQSKRDQIHAEKVAFIATQLNLTTEEAQKFWPVYNTYEAEIEAIRKERRGYLKELRKPEALSADRSYELFELIFATEKKESDIRLKYLSKFSTVVGKKKAANVFIAEERFKHELMKKFKDDGHFPPPPPE
ncbi:hypothetical protein N8987_01800 [Crocinitomix sp.]|nr:hypothetical protein [Crocinitomix sp.]